MLVSVKSTSHDVLVVIFLPVEMRSYKGHDCFNSGIVRMLNLYKYQGSPRPTKASTASRTNVIMITSVDRSSESLPASYPIVHVHEMVLGWL